MKNQKTVAAIHDISGFGKCSLTVALPILSACGITTAVIPTAVLSTHTGGFTGYTCCDLTNELLPIAQHWSTLGIDFDAIYTGYLASFEQIELVLKAVQLLKNEHTLLIVDPAMADNGKLYPAFDMRFAEQMKRLCSTADIIIPNITEACLLTGLPYKSAPHSPDYITQLMDALSKIGAKKIVLTGVQYDEETLGAVGLDCANGENYSGMTRRIDGMYHGTGDVYASALVGALLSNDNLEQAMQIAAEFTAGAIERTLRAGTDVRFGVAFEQELPTLIERLSLS